MNYLETLDIKTHLMKKFKQIFCKTCNKATICGKRGLCNNCYIKAQKAKERIEKKKEKVKIKKENEVSDKQLDTLTSILVRTIYPSFCHGSCSRQNGKPRYFEFKDLQNCHLVPRKKSLWLKYDLANLLPGCGPCNGFDELHIIGLYKWQCHYWGSELIDNLNVQYRRTYLKYTGKLRKEIYDVYKKGLEKARIILENEDMVWKLNQMAELRKELREKYIELITPHQFFK